MQFSFKRIASLVVVSFFLFSFSNTFMTSAETSKSTTMDINLVLYRLNGLNKGEKMTTDTLRVGDKFLAVLEVDNMDSVSDQGIFSLTSSIEYDSHVLQNTLLPSEPASGSSVSVSDLSGSAFGNNIDPKLNAAPYQKQASDIALGGTQRRFISTFLYNQSAFNTDELLNGNDKKTLFAIPFYVKLRPTSGQTIISIDKNSPNLQMSVVVDSVTGRSPNTISKTAAQLEPNITVGEKIIKIIGDSNQGGGVTSPSTRDVSIIVSVVVVLLGGILGVILFRKNKSKANKNSNLDNTDLHNGNDKEDLS